MAVQSRFATEDILKLTTGGSGFSAHNDVEAKAGWAGMSGRFWKGLVVLKMIPILKKYGKVWELRRITILTREIQQKVWEMMESHDFE